MAALGGTALSTGPQVNGQYTQQQQQPTNVGTQQPSLGGGALASGTTSAPYAPTYQNNQQGQGYMWNVGPQQAVDTTKVGGAQNYFQDAQNAYWNSATSRLDPMWQQRQSDLETQLANMGLTRGSEAWTREMGNLGRDRNDAYQQALNTSITNSAQDATRLQGMDLASQQAYNQAVGQGFNQNLAQGTFYNDAYGKHMGDVNQAKALTSAEQVAAANRQAQAENLAKQLAAQEAMQNAQLQAQQNMQSSALAQAKYLAEAQMGMQKDQFGMTLAEQVASRNQQGSQFSQQLGQQASQFGQTLAEQIAARDQAAKLAAAQMAQQNTQFGLTLAEQQAGRTQQNTQFGQTLAEQIAARQQAEQLAQAQLAQQLSIAQGGWANQQSIANTSLAGQQAMANAQLQAAASQAAAQLALGQGQLDLANRTNTYNQNRQAQFDPYLLEQLRLANANATLGGGTLNPTATV